MFNGWKITNILDVGLCELDTADGPYNKTGYRLEHREDGFAITVGLMEYISGWSALEILYWLHEKQAIPRRYDNAGQDMHPMDQDEPEKWARIIHPDRHMPASWDGPGD